MKDYTVEIIIYEDGSIVAESLNMKGDECVSALGEILSGVEGERHHSWKPEYYNKATIRQRNQNSGHL